MAGGANLAVGDVITVTGTLLNKDGKVQFDAKSTYVLSDANIIAKDKAALSLEESYHANFNLLLEGANGSTIVWTTKEATEVVSIDPSTGVVTINPVDPSTTIVLVATITKGTESDTREFTVNILKEAPQYTVNYSAGENGTITVKAGETDVKTGDKVVADTKLTVTVAPTEGFRLASVTVNGTADTSVAGKTSFELTITAETTFAVAFETIPVVKEFTISFANANARESLDENSQVWKSGDLVFTNSKGSSTSNVADYTNPVRLYKNSTVKIELANITKIEFNVNTKNKPIANLQNSLKDKGTVTVTGSTLTIEFETPQSIFEFVCVEQIRLNSLTVYTA